MFSGASSFNQNISNWDVSNAERMTNVFNGATVFNQHVRLWEVIALSHQRNDMFLDAKAMNTEYAGLIADTPDDSFFNVRFNLTPDPNKIKDSLAYYINNMDDGNLMYDEKTKITASVGRIGTWNTQNVTDMKSLFMDNDTFNEDISDWDVSNVDDMTNMFSGATAFSQNISHWRLKPGCIVDGMFIRTGMEKYTYIDGYGNTPT